MTTRLTPYGSSEHAQNVAMVGKGKIPQSLANRMPPAELAAKIGPVSGRLSAETRRVVRLHAQD